MWCLALPELQNLPASVKTFFEAYIQAIPCKHTICTDDIEIHQSLCHLGKRDDHFTYSHAYANFLALTYEN